MTADTLKSYTLKDLTTLAKKKGVNGWHAMRKDQLVKALVKNAKRANALSAKKPAKKPSPAVKSRLKAATARTASPVRKPVPRSAPRTTVNAKAHGTNGHVVPSRVASSKPASLPPRRKNAHLVKRLELARVKNNRSKNLASFVSPTAAGGFTRDRLVALVRDPFWLHAYWELTRKGVQRAQAAMGQDWHTAKPVLRLVEVSHAGATSSTEALVKNIEIHGGVNNWYIDVLDPPKSYRVDIGYLASTGKFFLLARSNVVSTPKAGASDSIDENWTDVAENFDKIYAMSGGYAENGSAVELTELFEERLRRPMGAPIASRIAGMNGFDKKREFGFELDAELIVYGATEPTARVTLQGDPVKLRPDGTFTVRFSMPNCRQVIPAVASSADGLEQRTVVLAVERNTKVMEPLVRDGNE